MENSQKILNSFSLRKSLNPKIWENPLDPKKTKLKDRLRIKLLEISNQFQEFVGIPVVVSDIHMTGSLANFNWSEYSDVDLHLIVNLKQFSEKQKDLYNELFKLKKTLFNLQHNIKILGYDVELYIQDSNEEHTSSGVYSVLNDTWVVMPSREDFEIDKKVLMNKVNSWLVKIDETIEQAKEEESLEKSLEFLDKLRKKIKEYRSSGLSKNGEFSYENLVFKFLRRNGYIEKLFDFENQHIDKKLSIPENNLIRESDLDFSTVGSNANETYGLSEGPVGSTGFLRGGVDNNWAGSMTRALAVAKEATNFKSSKGTKFKITSQKRSRKTTASGNISDHYYKNYNSYAVDIGCRGDDGDELYNHLIEFMGRPDLKIKVGTPNFKGVKYNFWIDGYRYQILWKSDGLHNNHIHLGVRFGKNVILELDQEITQVPPEEQERLNKKVKKKESEDESIPQDTEPGHEDSSGDEDPIKKIKNKAKDIQNKFGGDFLKILTYLMASKEKRKELRSKWEKEWEEKNKKGSEESSQETPSSETSTSTSTTSTTVDRKKLPVFDRDFYESVLEGLGAPITKENLKFLYAWRQSEGGNSKNNPFATMYNLGDDCYYNCVNNSGQSTKPTACRTCPQGYDFSVKNYKTPQIGIEATVKSLLDSKYTCIVDGLKNNIGALKISECESLKTWGSGDLVKEVLLGYENTGNINSKPITT